MQQAFMSPDLNAESRLCPWQNIEWDELPILKGNKLWTRSYFRVSHSHIKDE